MKESIEDIREAITKNELCCECGRKVVENEYRCIFGRNGEMFNVCNSCDENDFNNDEEFSIPTEWL